MKMSSRLFAILMMMMAARPALAYQSSFIQPFNLVQCLKNQCLRASADIAFLSMNQDSMAASNVKLELLPDPLGRRRVQTCATFRFDLKTQFLTCDNRDISEIPTLLIDSKFKISTVQSADKPVYKRTKS
jgi:hypothetical protein